MSNIDKRALREAAEKALNARARLALMQSVFDDDGDDVKPEAQEDISICVSFNDLTNPATVLALLDELEAKDQRIAELSALQGKPIAWESTTPVYVKFITDERYQRLRPGYKKWYKPYRCSQCAAAGKGEAS